MEKALVLLSGGVDSTTTLYYAFNKFGKLNTSAVSFDYGQKQKKELDFARVITHNEGIEHHIVGIPFTQMKIRSALTTEELEVPRIDYSEIQGVSPAYVPFRNGTMISLAVAIAVSEGIDFILAGPHSEDATSWAYADCTPEFIGAMAAAVYVGTYGKQRLLTPLLHMSKAEVCRLGHNLGAPLFHTWSCYIGGDIHCGTCPTCRARRKAFAEAGLTDTTPYADGVAA